MTALPAAARALETRIQRDIPLTRAIDLGMHAWDGDTLIMTAPLAPNVNDKGCAFGGSLSSAMTVAGWALVVLALEKRNLSCDVFVGRSEVVYHTPVWADFQAHATLAEGTDWDTFFDALSRRGKARASLHCHIRESGNDMADNIRVCATLDAVFVAKQRDPRHVVPGASAAQ